MNYHYVFRSIFIGNTGVGKSSIIQKYVNKTFDDHSQSTIGIDYLTKIISIGERSIKLQMWDLTGQFSFRNLIQSYYRQASIIFFVFDRTNRSSFTDFKEWIKHLEPQLDRSQLVIIGNKSDMAFFGVSTEEGQELAERYNAFYYEVSAKQDDNLAQIFEEPVRKLYEKMIPETIEPQSVHVDLSSPLLSTNPNYCCFL